MASKPLLIIGNTSTRFTLELKKPKGSVWGKGGGSRDVHGKSVCEINLRSYSNEMCENPICGETYQTPWVQIWSRHRSVQRCSF